MNRLIFILLLLFSGISFSQELDLQGSRVDTDTTGNIVTLSGNATVAGDNFSVSADLIRIFRDKQIIEAEGNLQVRIHGSEISGTAMTFHIPDKTAVVHNGRLRLPDGITFDAKEIHALPEDRFRLVQAAMTTCPDCCRHWTFNASEVNVRREGYAFFRNLTFRVGDRSWFYLPGLIYPAKTQRALGLLIPEIGNSSKLGFHYNQDLFIPLGPSMDMTYTLDHYAEAGTGNGLEFRIAKRQDEFGRIYGYAINDKLTDSHRSFVDASYDLGFGNRSHLTLRSLEGSDFDIFRDFTMHQYDLAMRDFHSALWLDLVQPRYRLTVGADRVNRMFTDQDLLFQQLPALNITMRPQMFGNVLLTASADVRHIDNPLQSDSSYYRGTADVAITHILPLGSFSLAQHISAGYRSYGTDSGLENHGILRGEWLIRTPEFRRTGKHVVHGFRMFAGVAYTNTDTVYPEHIHDTIDYVNPDGWNLRAGFESTWTVGDRSGTGGVYVTRNISDNLYRNIHDPEQSDETAPVIGFLQLPFENWGVNVSMRYDPALNDLDRALVGIRFKDHLSVSWLRAHVYETDESRDSLVGSFSVPLSERWSLNGRADYDFKLDDFRYREFQIQYFRDCIGFRIGYRYNAYSVNTSNEYSVSLVLRGIGELIKYGLGR